ncbi:hypothetical protein IJ579_08785 [bacterium]|nr:hypothetical protein [bacterium]
MQSQKVSFTQYIPSSKMEIPQTTQPTQPKIYTEPYPQKPETNHKKRNWTIGLSAAAVLIGLGVLVRKGAGAKLEPKIERTVEEIAQELAGKTEGRAVEEATTIISHAGEDVGATVIGHAGENIAAEEATTVLGRAAEEIKIPEINPEAINEALDRTLVEGLPTHVDFPPTTLPLEGIDLSKIKLRKCKILDDGTYRYVHQPLFSRKKIVINLDAERHPISVSHYRKGKRILYARYKEGELLNMEKDGVSFRYGEYRSADMHFGSHQLNFNSEGDITSLWFYKDSKNIKDFTYSDGEISSITYYDVDSPISTLNKIKTELYNNGLMVSETFYNTLTKENEAILTR